MLNNIQYSISVIVIRDQKVQTYGVKGGHNTPFRRYKGSLEQQNIKMKKIFEDLLKNLEADVGGMIYYEENKPVVQSYINGKWIKGNGSRFKVISPTTNGAIGYSYSCDSEQIKEASKAARQSQEYWRFNVSQQEKENIYKRICGKLNARRLELALIMTSEGGKTLMETDGDVQETMDCVDHYTGEISRIHGEIGECQMLNKDSLTIREPYKVFLGVCPWNFPMAIPSWKIFGALTAGSACILKASSQTPFSASLLVSIIHESLREVLGKERAGNLGGLIQTIHGKGSTTGMDIIKEGDYDILGFTGGAETAKTLAEITGSRLIPSHFELGGKNGMAIMDDFNVDLAVAETINAAYGTSGQRCVSLSRVYVHEDIYETFIEKLKEATLKIKIGSPFDVKTKVQPIVSKSHLKKVHSFTEWAEEQGIKPFLGGYPLTQENIERAKKDEFNFEEKDFEEGGICSKGNFYVPTIYTNLAQDTKIMQEEVFGPVLAVSKFSKGKDKFEALENAIKLLNDSQYGLSSSLLTNDKNLIHRAMKRIDTGILYIGRGTTGAELNQYFGGTKRSGWGREGKGVEAFTYIKQVYVDFHGKARMAQIGAVEDTLRNAARTIGLLFGRSEEEVSSEKYLTEGYKEDVHKITLNKLLDGYEITKHRRSNLNIDPEVTNSKAAKIAYLKDLMILTEYAKSKNLNLK